MGANQTKPTKVLSVFTLAMISVAGIVSIRSLPLMASVGLASIFFYVLAALVFLIPSALVCAELASSWPEEGGVYLWVKKAFGAKLGFFSIWSEWFNNIIGFPATLSFIAATLLFIFGHHLNQHKYILFTIMLVIIWGCTLFNFLGIKASSRLNIIGAIVGSIIPGAVIIILAIFWLIQGDPIQIKFSLHKLLPPMHIKDVVFFLGVLSGYAGMQITAFHAPNVKNPKRDFPYSIGISVIMILSLTIFASLAIALVIPSSKLSLVSGVMEGFFGFFQAFHLNFMLPILALLIALSGISTLSAWLLAPARGLAVAASQGLFPAWCAHVNKHQIPTHILLVQAIFATVLSLLFLFTTQLSTAFWMLLVLTSQFTLVMYVLIFSSAIYLRYSKADTPRGFKIPGGKPGIWVVAGTSIVACIAAIVLGYFPPKQLHITNLWQYESFLILGNIFYITLPIIIYKTNKQRSCIRN